MMKNIFSGIVGIAMLALALPVFAQTSVNNINNVCVQTAVDVREQSIIDAWGVFNTSMMLTLSARKSALHDAWGMTDAKARRVARATAWETFRVSNKKAHEALRISRKSTWDIFRTASKACNVPVVEAHAVEVSGGISL